MENLLTKIQNKLIARRRSKKVYVNTLYGQFSVKSYKMTIEILPTGEIKTGGFR